MKGGSEDIRQVPFPIQRGEAGSGAPRGKGGSRPCGLEISIYTHSGDPVRPADARWCRYLPPGTATPTSLSGELLPAPSSSSGRWGTSGRSLWRSVAAPRFLPPARGSVRPFDSLVSSLGLYARDHARWRYRATRPWAPFAMPYIRDRWPTDLVRGSLVLCCGRHGRGLWELWGQS